MEILRTFYRRTSVGNGVEFLRNGQKVSVKNHFQHQKNLKFQLKIAQQCQTRLVIDSLQFSEVLWVNIKIADSFRHYNLDENQVEFPQNHPKVLQKSQKSCDTKISILKKNLL